MNQSSRLALTDRGQVVQDQPEHNKRCTAQQANQLALERQAHLRAMINIRAPPAHAQHALSGRHNHDLAVCDQATLSSTLTFPKQLSMVQHPKK